VRGSCRGNWSLTGTSIAARRDTSRSRWRFPVGKRVATVIRQRIEGPLVRRQIFTGCIVGEGRDSVVITAQVAEAI